MNQQTTLRQPRILYLIEAYLKGDSKRMLAISWKDDLESAIDEGYEFMELFFFSDLDQEASESYKNLVKEIETWNQED